MSTANFSVPIPDSIVNEVFDKLEKELDTVATEFGCIVERVPNKKAPRGYTLLAKGSKENLESFNKKVALKWPQDNKQG